MKQDIIKTDNYLLVVDGSEVTPLNWCLDTTTNLVFQYYTKREVKTTDKKIIAHLPLNGSFILEGVDLLPPLEDEDSEIESSSLAYISEEIHNHDRVDGFIDGYHEAKEKYKYTEEDMITFGIRVTSEAFSIVDGKGYVDMQKFDKILQSLSQPKMPIGFECEMIEELGEDGHSIYGYEKTTTTSEGYTQWVGTYIYE